MGLTLTVPGHGPDLPLLGKELNHTQRVHAAHARQANSVRAWLEALGIMDEREVLVGAAPECPSGQLRAGCSDAGLHALGCKVTAGLRVSKDGNAGTGLNSVWHVVRAH